MKRILPPLLVSLALTIAGAGCAPSGEADKPSSPELIVSAAASLSLPLEEIRANYEERSPGVTVRINYGSTGGLQKQIEMGIPADVFLAAGRKQMDQLLDQSLIDPSKHTTLLTNRLVVIVPSDREQAPASLEELGNDAWGKVAVGVPETVPAGAYAKEALEAASLWDDILPKAVYGKDVRQVLTSVETGNADTGFVYATDAMSSKKARVAFEVAAQLHAPIEYPVGVLTATEHPEEAEAFFMYLQSEEALRVFETYGFGTKRP